MSDGQRGSQQDGPRVVHVTTVDMSLRYLLLNQLAAIREAGFDVSGASAPGPDVETITASGFRHYPIALNRRTFTPLRDLRAFWQLVRLFRRERFTIVHTHNPKPGFWGQLAARVAGVPYVVNTLHGFYFHDGTSPVARRLLILLEKIAARCSDVILSQNREDIATAVEARICAPDRIRPLGNGIDLSRFDPASVAQGARDAVRAELGIQEDALVVGFVGRLVEEKGVPELIEAMALVRREVPNACLLLVGPVDEHKPDALSPRHIGEDARSYCHFAGLRQDMPEVYSAMDVFAMPSHREGFPRSPMEAGAMGLPAVLTDIRGCREVVSPHENGLLVPVRDSERLATALRTLLIDADTRARMGAAGVRVALERFDERQVFSRVVGVYRELLMEHRGHEEARSAKTGGPDDSRESKISEGTSNGAPPRQPRQV